MHFCTTSLRKSLTLSLEVSDLPHSSATGWGCWAAVSAHTRPASFPPSTDLKAPGHNKAAGNPHVSLGKEKTTELYKNHILFKYWVLILEMQSTSWNFASSPQLAGEESPQEGALTIYYRVSLLKGKKLAWTHKNRTSLCACKLNVCACKARYTPYTNTSGYNRCSQLNNFCLRTL